MIGIGIGEVILLGLVILSLYIYPNKKSVKDGNKKQ